jgi:hypothetical protein
MLLEYQLLCPGSVSILGQTKSFTMRETKHSIPWAWPPRVADLASLGCHDTRTNSAYLRLRRT